MSQKINRRILLGGALALLCHQAVSSAEARTEKQEPNEETELALALDHEHYMRLAIDQGKKVPDCPFGAVIVNVKSKEVVGEGFVRADKNPIWHGEMTAINSCADVDKGFKWNEVALYTTGESCPMCQSAIIWTGMPLVVYGSDMPFLQSQGFGEINIRARKVIAASLKGSCRIIGGVLEKECNQLFIDARKRVQPTIQR